ncbi:hypothetical protein Tcan_00064 [Toxocara canis]|uniref:Uncharacterized protein n=1 Tax=Toxocara canis TaxID=6265 RepID=A0A0B2V9Q2_TOXCA|nr:hypothetical protein Tcan_00064 [Toxocara canis]
MLPPTNKQNLRTPVIDGCGGRFIECICTIAHQKMSLQCKVVVCQMLAQLHQLLYFSSKCTLRADSCKRRLSNQIIISSNTTTKQCLLFVLTTVTIELIPVFCGCDYRYL